MSKKITQLIVLVVFGAFIAMPSYAAEVEDERAWLNITANGPTADVNWRWYLELQPRWRNEGRQFDQAIARTAVYFALNDQSSVWFGYAHVLSYPAGRPNVDEHRLWQQYLVQFEVAPTISLQSRTRLEQRWIENAQDTGYKLRQLFRLSGPTALHEKLKWVIYDEYFINLNSTDYGARSGFDQNRLFLGGNWPLSDQAKLEMGYLNQRINGATTDAENHVLSSAINFSF